MVERCPIDCENYSWKVPLFCFIYKKIYTSIENDHIVSSFTQSQDLDLININVDFHVKDIFQVNDKLNKFKRVISYSSFFVHYFEIVGLSNLEVFIPDYVVPTNSIFSSTRPAACWCWMRAFLCFLPGVLIESNLFICLILYVIKSGSFKSAVNFFQPKGRQRN